MDGAVAVMILMACQPNAGDCAPATVRAQRFATPAACEAAIPDLLRSRPRATLVPRCAPLAPLCAASEATLAPIPTRDWRPALALLCDERAAD